VEEELCMEKSEDCDEDGVRTGLWETTMGEVCGL